LRLGCLALLLLLAAGLLCRHCGTTLALYIGGFWYDSHSFDRQIREAAHKYGLDSRLVKAVVYQESRFNPLTVGKDGEIGLMQILPRGAVADWATARKVPPPSANSLFSPELNLEIGCWYLARAVARWRDYEYGIELALCQYNAGPTRAAEWMPESVSGEVIDRIQISGTRRYVTEIMERYRFYCRNNPFERE